MLFKNYNLMVGICGYKAKGLESLNKTTTYKIKLSSQVNDHLDASTSRLM